MPTPAEQQLSRTIYDTDGTTTVWDFSFSGGYLDPSHVKAYTELPSKVRTEISLAPGQLIGEFQLQITPALAAGSILVIYRDTPKNLPLVDFVSGPLSETALDTNAKQAVFIAAEAIDIVNATDVSAAIGAAEDAAASAAVALAQADIATAQAASATASAVTATTQAGIATAGGNAAGASATAALDSQNAAAASAVTAQNAATTAANDAVAAIPVSPFMRTVLDDADAAAARATLGLAGSGLRNLIINGNFAINQRGYVSGTATSGANQYTLDRWRVVTSGQNATFTASGNGNIVTAPAGGIEQVIEGNGIAGGTYVINWTGTATCRANGIELAKGSTATLTARTGVTFRFSGGTVGEVQLEPGTVVTPFEARPIGLELMLCQRYYEVVSFGGRSNGSPVWGNVIPESIAASFKQEKRAVPTIAEIGVDQASHSRTYAANTRTVFVHPPQSGSGVWHFYGILASANAEL